MNRRTVLLGMVVLIALVGIVLATVPFMRALGPTPVAGRDLPRIDISRLQAGDYMLVEPDDPPGKNADTMLTLIIRDYDGRLSVLGLPRQPDGRLRLPDVGIMASGLYIYPDCKDFGPDMEGGKIVRRGALRCKDEVVPDKFASTPRGRWSYAGKNLFNHTPDLIRWRYTLENNFLVLRQYEVPDDYWTIRG